MFLTPWVSRIIFLNVAIFLAGLMLPGFQLWLGDLVLIPSRIPEEPWTLVTYMFLHAGFGHVFFNMLTLFFFGPRLEAHLGGRRFLLLYFISGIAGALLSWVFSPNIRIVGASGAIMGVMFGFARYWPRETIFLYFVPVEARFAVLIFAAIDLFAINGANVAHFAHLGGGAGGFLYLQLSDYLSLQRGRRFQAKATPPRPSRGDLHRWSRIDREKLHVVNRDEFDRIMRKIQEEGVGSITPQERSFLDNFSERMGSSHEEQPRS